MLLSYASCRYIQHEVYAVIFGCLIDLIKPVFVIN